MARISDLHKKAIIGTRIIGFRGAPILGECW